VGDHLDVTRRGESGPVAVLVHGAVMAARMSFGRQKPLTDRYQLWLVGASLNDLLDDFFSSVPQGAVP
jgi:hypothetical protein